MKCGLIKILKPLDFLAGLLSLGLIVVFSLSAFETGANRVDTEIDAPGGKWIYPLDQSRIVRVEGPIGDTEIEILDGKVRVLDSPCPNKLCIRMGAISRSGSWIACLPNHIFVKIRSAKGEEVDAHSY